MLQVYSTDRGLLVPTVMLTENEGKIVAPTISNNPADGLIIFHDGRNNIGKGLYYYDAILQQWKRYSDFTQTQANLSLDNFAEIFEARSLGNGTPYALLQDYYIPWNSGEEGLNIGTSFVFVNDTAISVSQGVSMEADLFRMEGIGETIFSVVISATLTSTTPLNTITGRLFLNGTEVDNIFFRHTFQLKDNPTNLRTSGNIVLTNKDLIDFRFISDEKNKGVEVENLNIRFEKLGEL